MLKAKRNITAGRPAKNDGQKGEYTFEPKIVFAPIVFIFLNF